MIINCEDPDFFHSRLSQRSLPNYYIRLVYCGVCMSFYLYAFLTVSTC